MFPTFLIWLLVVLAIRLLSYLEFIPFVYQNISVFTAILLMYPPVIWAMRKKVPLDYCQISFPISLRALKVFSFIAIMIFPLTFLGNHFYQKFAFGFSYISGTPASWKEYILSQFLLTALPEEFFFRGFLQERLASIFPTTRKIWGAPFGKAALITSLLFALSHSLITFQWWHIFIFFPGLIFGWLKEKTGTIWASIFFHTSCNLFAYWVALHYAPR